MNKQSTEKDIQVAFKHVKDVLTSLIRMKSKTTYHFLPISSAKNQIQEFDGYYLDETVLK